MRLPWRKGRFGTVRARLTLLATVVVAAVLTASAIALVIVQQRLLTHGVDEALIQRADNIQADVERGAFGASLPTEADREDSFLQLLDGRGRVVAASANAASIPPATEPLAVGEGQVISSVSDIAVSTHDFRVLARRVGTSSTSGTLVVAKNLDDVEESVTILTTSLALSIPVVVALLAALLWWLTGRVLLPVETIRAEVASIHGLDLRRRVPVQDSQDEISRLARTMNAMLDRVQQATERQRQFVADASHELRGPLTQIRTDLEVSIAHPATTNTEALHQRLLASSVQLQRLVDDLLFLARSESGTSDLPPSPVDLDDLVLEEVRWLRERGIVRVEAGAVSAARVLGDAGQLARALRNLSRNAERHATTTVTFELNEHDGVSRLVVADDGPGIPAEHHAAVFERFTRLDEARSRDAGGAGLGLAIVHDIVMRHRGEIVITSTGGQGARLELTLPRSD